MVKQSVLCEHLCSECGKRLAHGDSRSEIQHRLGRHIPINHWAGHGEVDCKGRTAAALEAAGIEYR